MTARKKYECPCGKIVHGLTDKHLKSNLEKHLKSKFHKRYIKLKKFFEENNHAN